MGITAAKSVRWGRFQARSIVATNAEVQPTPAIEPRIQRIRWSIRSTHAKANSAVHARIRCSYRFQKVGNNLGTITAEDPHKP
jgi:hypothetical protein